MRRIPYFILDVFTDRPLAGNPLTVFPDRTLLSERELLHIAREFNLGQTVFVEPSEKEGALRRLRIFTTRREVPLAGHPVVGAWFLLAQRGLVDLDAAQAGGLLRRERVENGREVLQLRHELGAGVLPLSIYMENGSVTGVAMEQSRPTFGEEIRNLRSIARALSIDEGEILSTGLYPMIVSTGLCIMMVPVSDSGALRRITMNLAAVDDICRGDECVGAYAFTTDVREEWAFARARGIFPGIGVLEDPAAGAAAGCLGAYLARHEIIKPNPSVAFEIEQGFEVGRPSRIGVEVTAEDDEITHVRVGGGAVITSEAELLLPD